MIIGLEGFGSIWSVRAACRERTAFYNTTGIISDGRLRHRSRLFGQVRFNARGGFNPERIETNVGHIFQSPGLPVGDNRCLLLDHLLKRPQAPDYYLFQLESERAGEMRVDEIGWKSEGVVLLSLSQCRQLQEAMLLIPVHGWIRSSLGRYAAEPARDRPWRAFLTLKA